MKSWPGNDKLDLVLACCLSVRTHTCVAYVADKLLVRTFGRGRSSPRNQSTADYIGVTIDQLRSRKT